MVPRAGSPEGGAVMGGTTKRFLELVGPASVDGFLQVLDRVIDATGPGGEITQGHLAACRYCQRAPEGESCSESRAIYDAYIGALRLRDRMAGRKPARRAP